MAQRAKSVRGLHLWAVKLEGTGTTLWITTRRPSIADALNKVPTAAKNEGLSGRVVAVEAHGTLDA